MKDEGRGAYLPREDETHHTTLEMVSAWPRVHVALLFVSCQVVPFFVRSIFRVKLLQVVDEVIVALSSHEPVCEGGHVSDVLAVRELQDRALPLVQRPAKSKTKLTAEVHLEKRVFMQSEKTS